ncbi:MAG: hypothetical protein WKG06_45255 [Segetibacter sp.]
MQRRSFIKSAVLGSTAVFMGSPLLKAHAGFTGAAVSAMKITKIRYYSAPGYNKPLFNQARGIVEIETDGGIIGIGEGGSKDMIEQCAQMMIGEDPFRIEHLVAKHLPGHVLSAGTGKAACTWRFGNGIMGY